MEWKLYANSPLLAQSNCQVDKYDDLNLCSIFAVQGEVGYGTDHVLSTPNTPSPLSSTRPLSTNPAYPCDSCSTRFRPAKQSAQTPRALLNPLCPCTTRRQSRPLGMTVDWIGRRWMKAQDTLYDAIWARRTIRIHCNGAPGNQNSLTVQISKFKFHIGINTWRVHE